MTWKKLNNAHFGSSTTFGGADIDKISKLFDGTADIDEQDINTNWPIRSGKLKFRNPADTFSYTISPSAIPADRTLTLPALANDSEFLFENAAQTISNQTLSSCSIQNPTYSGLGSKGIIQDPSIKRWGFYMPTGAANTPSGVGTFGGLLSRHTVSANSVVASFDTGGGPGGITAQLTTSTTNYDTAGLFPNTSVSGPFRTAKAGKIRANFALQFQTSGMAMMGLASFTSVASLLTGVLHNHSGVLVGIYQPDFTAVKYVVHFNDGSSFPTASWISSNDTDFNFHTFEISWPDGGTPINITFDESQVASFESPMHRIPSSSTNLYFWFALQKSAGSGTRSVTIKGIWIETD